MNPKTSVSKSQIREIFRHHNLAQDPKTSRIKTGFTNEVHEVDGYILRICVRKNFEEKFLKEVELYKKLKGQAMIPEFVLADNTQKIIGKPYLIYKKIPGKSAGHVWHLLDDSKRRQIIKDFCEQLRIISSLEPHPKLTPGPTWLDNMQKAFDADFVKLRDKKILPESQIKQVVDYIESNKHVLKPQKLAFMYWDPNLDNIIVDEQAKMVGLVDFDHVGVVSIDFPLNEVREIIKHPHLRLSLEAEKYASKDNYKHLMDWYKEFYPELFDIPDLEKRLDLYELEGILRMLPRFPKAQQLHERLDRILAQA